MDKPIGEIKTIMLLVSNVNRSVKFYRDVLGLTVLDKSPGFAKLMSGELKFLLSQEKLKRKPEPGCTIIFEVEDISKATLYLKTKKVKFREEPKEYDYGWTAVFLDPDGYSLELYQG
jgi:catechol 2,3-dioxygenase-like lactoylglutathione lyase family enzyme